VWIFSSFLDAEFVARMRAARQHGPPFGKSRVRQSRHHIIKGKKGRCVVVKQEKGDGKKRMVEGGMEV